MPEHADDVARYYDENTGAFLARGEAWAPRAMTATTPRPSETLAPLAKVFYSHRSWGGSVSEAEGSLV